MLQVVSGAQKSVSQKSSMLLQTSTLDTQTASTDSTLFRTTGKNVSGCFDVVMMNGEQLPPRRSAPPSPQLDLMQSVLRFLQLTCENHNRFMQAYLRDQTTAPGLRVSHDLVGATLEFLGAICGSTSNCGLDLIGLMHATVQ